MEAGPPKSMSAKLAFPDRVLVSESHVHVKPLAPALTPKFVIICPNEPDANESVRAIKRAIILWCGAFINSKKCSSWE